MVSVALLNSFRHPLNHLGSIPFARQRKQPILLFPGEHTRLPSSQNLRFDDILGQQDEGVNISFPGLFLYTRGMPCMILANVNSPWGLVNGARGTAAGVILEPNSTITLSRRLLLLILTSFSCSRTFPS